MDQTSKEERFPFFLSLRMVLAFSIFSVSFLAAQEIRRERNRETILSGFVSYVFACRMYFLYSLLSEFITLFLFFRQIPRNKWLVKRGKHHLPLLSWVAKVRLKMVLGL
jgi:hypothetical protein